MICDLALGFFDELLEGVDLFLEGLHLLHRLRELAQADNLLGCFFEGCGGHTPVGAACGEVGDDACLGSDDGLVTDAEVTRDAALCCDGDVVAKLGAASDAGLRDDDAVLAHGDVVPNLNKVVNFAAFSDDGASKSCSVDGAVGSNIDVISDDDDTDLINRVVVAYLLVEEEAKAICSDDGAGLDDYVLADDAALADGDALVELAVLANDAVTSDNAACTNVTAISNLGACLDDDAWTDAYLAGVELGGLVNIGMWGDAWLKAMDDFDKVIDEAIEGEGGILYFNEGGGWGSILAFGVVGETGGDEYGTRACF